LFAGDLWPELDNILATGRQTTGDSRMKFVTTIFGP